MRRLIHHVLAWWNRPVTVEYELDERGTPVNQEAEIKHWLGEAERRRKVLDQPPDAPQHAPVAEPSSAPPVDALTTVVVQMHAVARERYQRVWGITPPLPAAVRDSIPQMVREAVGSTASPLLAFTAHHLPLMTGLDAQAIRDWHPIAIMILRSAQEFLRHDQRARLGRLRVADATLTIYAPPAWVANAPLRPVIEQHLLAAVSSAVGVQTGELLRATWEESDGMLLWNVELWDSAQGEEVAA